MAAYTHPHLPLLRFLLPLTPHTLACTFNPHPPLELMKQKAKERAGRVKSPFAVYAADGRLVCKVCKVLVKSTAAWPDHIQGDKHIEVKHCLHFLLDIF